MTDHETPEPPPAGGIADLLDRVSLDRRSLLRRLGAVGGITAASASGFLYAGGWFSPERLTPARFADRFERVSGRHEGFRRNHAKGVSAQGYFTSNGLGSSLSTASVFAAGRTPVTGRFSLSGGMPYAADTATAVRGLGLLFQLPDGEQWRTATVNVPVFTDRVPEGFYARLLASKPDPSTGKPDPVAMKDFLARFPETARAMAYIAAHPASPGFADSTFHGLNAFRFLDAEGRSTPVRWRFVPHDPVAPAPRGRPTGRDALFDALISRADAGALRWDLELIVGEPGDPTDDATTPWPASRRTVTAGTLTIDTLQTEAKGNSRDINFDPLVLPTGIAPSDDPLLSARSAVYAASYTRRGGEPKTRSAIQVEERHRDS